MHGDAGPEQVHALWVHEPGRQRVESVRFAVGDDGVSGVVAPLTARAEVGLAGEDVDQLPFALVAPLGAENDRGHLARLLIRLVMGLVVF